MASESNQNPYDLVVLGCGAAGLSAAVSYAAEARAQGKTARIAVLERASQDGRGGATRWTSSWFRITEDRGLDPAFVPRMEQVSGGLADLEYCRTLEREAARTLNFLEANDVELVFFKQPFPNRNTGGGLGMPARGGVGIVDGLAGVVDRTEGSEILYETEAVRLSLSDEGRIDGVMVRGRDGLLRKLAASAVVIACGGFEGSPQMLTQYLGDRAGDMPLIAPTLTNNRGDGIRMAVDIGADTAGQFDMFHGEPVDPRSNKPDAVVYPYPYGLVVNGQGRRFFDEGRDSFDSTFEALAYEIWKNQAQTAFFIGDQTTTGIQHIDAINLTDQPPVTAGSIGELAGKLGLDPAALEHTIAEYNAAIGPGVFDAHVFDGKATVGLDPPKSNWAFPIDTPPYIAYPLTCAITFTFGGVRTDSLARVVTPAGTPIPRLYAAGEVTGLYYKSYPAGVTTRARLSVRTPPKVKVMAQVVTPAGTPIPGLYAAGEVTGLYYKSYPAGTSVLRSATFGRIAGVHAASSPN